MAQPPNVVRHPRWTLAVVCAATFMLLLDLTIVAVALSNIQADFHADLGSLQWIVDAYTLPLAGLLLTAATLGDRMGRRRMYLAGMVIFTAGSLACAVAWSPLVLDLTRGLQGVGGAMLFGVSLPLIAAAFPEARARAGAIGVYGATLAGATAVGPLIGGALVDGPGWRWIFLINVPIGLAALLAGWFRLTESQLPVTRTADWPGAVLLTTGLLALLLALIRGNTDGWSAVRILALFALAAVLLAGFFVREVYAREPMLDLTLFKKASFSGIALTGFTLNATLVAATSFLGLYVINTLGYGPFQAGLRFLPLTVASFVAAPIVARLVDKVPPRFTVGGGIVLTAVGLALIARLDGDSGWTVLLPGFIVAGLGLGAASASISQAALAAVEESRAGMASGTVFTLRQTGLAAGVAVLGALFQHRADAEMHDGLAAAHLPGTQLAALAHAVGDGAGGRVADGAPAAIRPVLAAAARAATATAINEILVVGAIAAGLAAVFALIVVRRFPAREPSVAPVLVPALPVGTVRGVALVNGILVDAPLVRVGSGVTVIDAVPVDVALVSAVSAASAASTPLVNASASAVTAVDAVPAAPAPGSTGNGPPPVNAVPADPAPVTAESAVATADAAPVTVVQATPADPAIVTAVQATPADPAIVTAVQATPAGPAPGSTGNGVATADPAPADPALASVGNGAVTVDAAPVTVPSGVAAVTTAPADAAVVDTAAGAATVDMTPTAARPPAATVGAGPATASTANAVPTADAGPATASTVSAVPTADAGPATASTVSAVPTADAAPGANPAGAAPTGGVADEAPVDQPPVAVAPDAAPTDPASADAVRTEDPVGQPAAEVDPEPAEAVHGVAPVGPAAVDAGRGVTIVGVARGVAPVSPAPPVDAGRDVAPVDAVPVDAAPVGAARGVASVDPALGLPPAPPNAARGVARVRGG